MDSFATNYYQPGPSTTPLDTLLPTSLPGFRKLNDIGINNLFEIQKQAFEAFFNVKIDPTKDIQKTFKEANNILVAQPRDLLIQGPTGSGKTFAYLFLLLPYLGLVDTCCPYFHIHGVDDGVSTLQPRLTAIIIVPTRVLGEQVANTFNVLFGGRKNINLVAAYGKQSEASEAKQLEATTIVGKEIGWKNASVLVATPGRMLALLRTIPNLLVGLKLLILDEADALLGTLQKPAFSMFWLALEANLARAGQSQTRKPKDCLLGTSSDLVRKILVTASMPDPMLLKAVAGLRGGVLIKAGEALNPRGMKTSIVGRDENDIGGVDRIVDNHNDVDHVENKHENTETMHVEEDNKTRSFVLPDELEMKVFVGQRRRKTQQDTTDGELKSKSFVSDGGESLGLLCSIVSSLPKPLLVFTSSTSTAQRLCSILSLILATSQREEGVQAPPVFFLGPSTPSAIREKILNSIRESTQEQHEEIQMNDNQHQREQEGGNASPILVSAGVLTRGIDLPTVHNVVVLGVPAHTSILAHMAGRASRAYAHGTCTMVITKDETRKAQHILKKLGRGNVVLEGKETTDDFRDMLPKVLGVVSQIEKTHKIRESIEGFIPKPQLKQVLRSLQSSYNPKKLMKHMR